MRQCVEPGAVRQRTRRADCVSLVDPVNIGIIAMAHEQQIAMGQHGAFRPPGRAARVEKPGLGRSGCHRRANRRAARKQTPHNRWSRSRYADRRFDRLRKRRQHFGEARRWRRSAGSPNPAMYSTSRRCSRALTGTAHSPAAQQREQHLQKLGAILHAQHDAIAGFETARREPARNQATRWANSDMCRRGRRQ